MVQKVFLSQISALIGFHILSHSFKKSKFFRFSNPLPKSSNPRPALTFSLSAPYNTLTHY